ncbi:MAG: alpha-L-fucosidase [Clostridia bacterium]|nr:alpha-L-fucosidase [Clostridia bacterium]
MTSYITKKTMGDTSWFMKDRFGMFIHFGLYSVPARHEWIKNTEQMTDAEYDKYFEFFNPDMLDAKEWARAAKKAGMKYAVLTTKHHEGFCLFDSEYTDYKVTNTPYGKDIIKEFVEAFREEDLKVGLYYSLIDWHHPEFTIDFLHPLHFHADAEELNKTRDMKKYAQYMRDQVRELLTNYGKIDIMWFDYSYNEEGSYRPPTAKAWMKGKGKDDWESEKLNDLIRSIQPDIIINNRMDIEQDIWTPEQYMPQKWLTHPKTGELVTWEACHTFSGSWGYHRDEMTWKTPDVLINLLINCVSCGGNLIMNVGPTARGYFDKRAENALEVYAEWMKYNSSSIYGCTMAEPEFKAPNGCRLTQSVDGKRLYVHLIEYPYAFLEMPGFAGKVKFARLLHDGSEIIMTEKKVPHFGVGLNENDDLLVLSIPRVKSDMLVPVIELILK